MDKISDYKSMCNWKYMIYAHVQNTQVYDHT